MKTVHVPPTNEQGSYSASVKDNKDALWHYNNARAHDGLAPIRRMPNGTYYTRMWYVNRNDGQYRETVDEFPDYKEARAMLKEYRMADNSAHHYLSTRMCNNWKGE